MNYLESINASRRRKLTPQDKFDRHMRKARLQDIDSRKNIFISQSTDGAERSESRKNIKTSIY